MDKRKRKSKKYTALNLFMTFVVLSVAYLLVPASLEADLSSIFLTMSTFLFAILTGFFIARQNTRYNQIREQISVFDGSMTAVYRGFGNLSPDAEKTSKTIIKRHYDTILKTGRWDYHFMHKSTTIKDLGKLLHDTVGEQRLPSGRHLVLRDMIQSLDSMQIARKNMIALEVERIPNLVQTLVYFLAIMLLLVMALVPSSTLVFDAVLKGAFGTIVVYLVILLMQLDHLDLFEGTLGAASAKDVLDILAERR